MTENTIERTRRTRYLIITNSLLTGFFTLAGLATLLATGVVLFSLPVLALISLLVASTVYARRGKVVIASWMTLIQVFINVALVSFLLPFEHHLETYRYVTFMSALLLLAGLVAFLRLQILVVGVLNLILLNVAVWTKVVPAAGVSGSFLSAYIAQNLALVVLTAVSLSIRRLSEDLIDAARHNEEEAERRTAQVEESLDRSRAGLDVGESMLRLTEESGRSIAAVGERIARVQETAGRLSEDVRSVSDSLGVIDGSREQLGAIVSQTHNRAEATRRAVDTMADETEKTYHLSEALVVRLRQRAAEMDEQRARLGGVVERLHEVVRANRSMAESVSMISDIAAKTHVLSMNALIVAARAGSHGAGFTVVAQEVRELAEEASHRAQSIGVAVEESGRTAAEAEHATTELEALIESVHGELDHAVEGFQQIRGNMERLSDRGGSIREVMESLAHSVAESEARLGEVADHVMDGSARARSVSEALSAVVGAVTEVDEESRRLKAYSQEIAALGAENKRHIDALFASLQTDQA